MRTPAVELQGAVHLPLPVLADAFARGFAGYAVPVPADVAALELRLRLEHVHLGDSWVALRGGQVVGLALVARRGARSRMAALGVATEARRDGVGRVLTERLLEDARARGDACMVLECIDANAAALALYEAAGFRRVRRLVGWEGTLAPPVEEAQEVPLEVAVGVLARHAEAGLPWQLAPETAAGFTAPLRAYGLEGAVAVVSDAGPQARLLRALVVPGPQRRQGLGTRLVRALASGGAGGLLRVPALVPDILVGALFERAGLRRSALGQVELVHPLR